MIFMGRKEERYSTYRLSEECDVSLYFARKVRSKLGYGRGPIKTKKEFDDVCDHIQAIKNRYQVDKINGGVIECYFNGIGRYHPTEELLKTFGMKANTLCKLKRMLGIEGHVYVKEYRKIVAVIGLVNILYDKNVTECTLGYLENLMKMLECDNPIELIKKLKGAKES